MRSSSLPGRAATHTGSWSPDGQTLAYYRVGPGTHRDIWTNVTRGGAETFPRELVQRTGPAFSPDGKWLAYISDESGRDEVYVRPYPDRSIRYLISSGGGTEPVWSRDGRELFDRQQDALMAVPITLADDLEAGRATRLFEGQFLHDANNAV